MFYCTLDLKLLKILFSKTKCSSQRCYFTYLKPWGHSTTLFHCMYLGNLTMEFYFIFYLLFIIFKILFIYLFTYLFTYLFIYLFIRLFVYLFVYLFIYLFIYMFSYFYKGNQNLWKYLKINFSSHF